MLYVRFDEGGMKCLKRVMEALHTHFVIVDKWAFLTWPEEGGSEFSRVSVDVMSWIASPSAWLDVYQAPLATPSNVVYYGNASALHMEISCPETYYRYNWLSRIIYNIEIPTNKYSYKVLKLPNITIGLFDLMHSLRTIVPTQLSSLI